MLRVTRKSMWQRENTLANWHRTCPVVMFTSSLFAASKILDTLSRTICFHQNRSRSSPSEPTTRRVLMKLTWSSTAPRETSTSMQWQASASSRPTCTTSSAGRKQSFTSTWSRPLMSRSKQETNWFLNSQESWSSKPNKTMRSDATSTTLSTWCWIFLLEAGHQMATHSEHHAISTARSFILLSTSIWVIQTRQQQSSFLDLVSRVAKLTMNLNQSSWPTLLETWLPGSNKKPRSPQACKDASCFRLTLAARLSTTLTSVVQRSRPSKLRRIQMLVFLPLLRNSTKGTAGKFQQVLVQVSAPARTKTTSRS